MSVIGWVIYIIAIVAMFYFIGIKPSQKERKKQEALLASVAVGDTVLTTSGFYGVIIDMTDDTVIVEFGNNKNCRIPMQKAAIAQLEKPTPAVKSDDKKDSSAIHEPTVFCTGGFCCCRGVEGFV